MPVLAALYLINYIAGHPTDLSPVWLHLSSGAYLVLWLIAESLLGMYRFPLKLSDALILVGGFYAQFLLLAVSGESPGFAAYTGIYITMVALFGCFALLALRYVWTNTRRVAGKSAGRALLMWFTALTGLVVAVLPLVCLFFPVWSGFKDLSFLWQILNSGMLLANTVSTMRLLTGFSIFGKKDPLGEEYDEEWKKWAPATIILLILAVVAAAVVGGILQPA